MVEVGEIGGYKLVKQLGAGSFGEVWVAESPATGKLVALKINKLQELPLEKDQDPVKRFSKLVDYLESFHNEASINAMLKHENIPTQYDVGFERKYAYIASEFIKGRTLKDLLASGKRVKEEDVIEISRQIARALEYIHEKNLIHRDIKPANVMLTKSGGIVRVVLLDFGIAKPEMFEYNPFAATPTYTSPEQANKMIYASAIKLSPKTEEEKEEKQALIELSEPGKDVKIDCRSDLFSLGIIMYEMLTGRHPFLIKKKSEGEVTVKAGQKPPTKPVIGKKIVYEKPRTDIDSYLAILNVVPKTPHEITKGKVSKELSDIVMKLLEKNRDNRYKNASELLEDLNKISKPSKREVVVSKEIEDFVEKAFSQKEKPEKQEEKRVPKQWKELWLSSRLETKKRVLDAYLKFLDGLGINEWIIFTSPSSEFEKEKIKALKKAEMEGESQVLKTRKLFDRLTNLRKLFEESLPEESVSGLSKTERADLFWNSMREYVREMSETRQGELPKFKPQDVLDSWSESCSQALDWLALCEYRGYKIFEDEKTKALKAAEPAYHIVYSADEKEIEPTEREQSKKIFGNINFKLLNMCPWLLRLSENELKEISEKSIFTAESIAAKQALKLRKILEEHPNYIVTTTPIKEGFEEHIQNPRSGEVYGKVRVVDLDKSVGTTRFQKTLTGLTKEGFQSVAIKVRKVSELKNAEGKPLPEEKQWDVFKSFKKIHSREKDWTGVFETTTFYSVIPGDLLQKVYVKKRQKEKEEQIGIGFYVGIPHYSFLYKPVQKLHEEALKKLSEKTPGDNHKNVLEKIQKPGPGFIVSALVASILANKVYEARKQKNPNWSFTKLMNG